MMNALLSNYSPASLQCRFLFLTLLTIANSPQLMAEESSGPFLATGAKVGEVTSNHAILWTRLTAHPKPRRKGYNFRGSSYKNDRLPGNPNALWGACPGIAGRMRMQYGKNKDLSNAVRTDWVAVSEATDFAHQFELENLDPSTTYHYVVEAKDLEGESITADFKGHFKTAPKDEAVVPVNFIAATCLGYRDMDHDDGYFIYDTMLNAKPDFVVQTGDTVYLDSDWPRTTSESLARFHWQRITSMKRHVEFNRNIPCFWMKDDHDIYADNCWPELHVRSLDPFTFQDGQRIFLENTPMSKKTYRTFRWGKELQFFLLEGRDFRTANDQPDGPEKTILGKEQKEWFKKAFAESDATWKIVINPTPIVGPPREGKFDNHTDTFLHEGKELRNWMQKHGKDQTFIICGDIHYQYHTIDPETGISEFCSGPAGNGHAGGFTEVNRDKHEFFRVRGGYLSVAIEPLQTESKITFQFHSAKGKLVYEVQKSIAR